MGNDPYYRGDLFQRFHGDQFMCNLLHNISIYLCSDVVKGMGPVGILPATFGVGFQESISRRK